MSNRSLGPRTRDEIREKIGVFFLIQGCLTPGLLMLLFPGTFTTAAYLAATFHFPHFVSSLLGGALTVGGLLAIRKPTRDIGLAIGAGFFLIMGLNYLISFLEGIKIGALAPVLLTLAWGYADRAWSASGYVDEKKHPDGVREEQ